MFGNVPIRYRIRISGIIGSWENLAIWLGNTNMAEMHSWLVVSNIFFNVPYMGCHPKPIDEPFFKIVIAPPTR